MNKQKAWNDLLAILDNLEDSIAAYRTGRKNAYRQVAIGLRTLLCDPNSVLLRIFPTAAFHRLYGFAAKLARTQPHLLDSLVFSPPGKIRFDGKGNAKIEKLFDDQEVLLLKDWLDQPLVNKKITIKEFVSSIADKEGKHSDPEYNDTLEFVRQVSLADLSLHPELIVTIGEYVVQALRKVFSSVATNDQVEAWLKK